MLAERPVFFEMQNFFLLPLLCECEREEGVIVESFQRQLTLTASFTGCSQLDLLQSAYLTLGGRQVTVERKPKGCLRAFAKPVHRAAVCAQRPLWTGRPLQQEGFTGREMERNY